MLAKIIGALMGCILLVSSARAQAPLQWKLDKGQIVEVERIASQKQSVKVNDTSFKQDTKTTTHFRLVVKDIRADGYLIEALTTKVETKVSDDKAPKAPKPHVDELMLGSSFTFVISTRGRLSEFDGYENFLKKPAGRMDKDKLSAFRNETQIAILRRTYPEDALRDTFADLFGPLPDKDKTWERTYVEPISIFGSLRSTAKYAHAGHGKIDYTIETRYELPKDKLTGLLRVVKGNVDSDKARGTIKFDPRTGRLVEHERSMLLRGTLTIEAVDRQQPVEFSSENEVKIRVK